MTSRIFDTASAAYPLNEGVTARNLKGMTEFYEIKRPYILLLEFYDFFNNSVDYLCMGPKFYSSLRQIPTTSDFLQERSLHQHNFFELMIVLKGSTLQRIENQQYVYREGQCCFLNHNVRHVEVPTENTELCFLMLTDDFLLNLTENDIIYQEDGHPITNQNELYQLFIDCQNGFSFREKQYWDFYPIVPPSIIVPQIENYIAQIILENKELSPGSYLAIQSNMAKLFSKMLDSSIYHIRKVKPEHDKDEYLFTQIQEILEECCGKITRAELENQLNYTANHLNRIVKRSVGMSLLEFGRFFTLKEAARLLIQTNESISSIINKLGLSNRSYFYRIFKNQYGITPNEYRNVNR